MAYPDDLESLSIEELQAIHDNMANQIAQQSQQPAQGYDISYGQRVAGGLGNFLSNMTLGLSDKAIVGASELSGVQDAQAKWDAIKGAFAENAPVTNTAVGLTGALTTPVGAIGGALGAGKAANAILGAASKIPGGRFVAQRAIDFVPGAAMSGIAGYNAAPEGEEIENALGNAILGGGASMLLSPVARTLSGAKSAGKAIEASQEAKALGLTSREIAKSALTGGVDDAGDTLVQKQVKQLLSDANASTAKSGDELFGRILSNRDKLSAQYDELLDTANKLNDGKPIKLTANDKKSVLDWINSDKVPTSDKKSLKKLLDETVKEFNSNSGSANPFKQLMTDRTALNKVYQDVAPDAVDKLNKQLRKMFNAKLKATLGVVLPDSGVARLTSLDKAYAPYSALRNTIAKSQGKEALSMSLDDLLRTQATSGGLGTFIKTGFEKGGILGGLGTAAIAAPALMFARTPGGALSTARAARVIGGAIGTGGDIGQDATNKLIANYVKSVGESNKEFRKEKEAKLTEQIQQVAPVEQDTATKQDISFSQENLPPLINAMIQVESGGKRDAVSKAGAIGLMQLMPANAEKLGIDPLDPMQNIYGGMQILQEEMDRYQDPLLALAAYNVGSPKLNAAIRKAGSRDWEKVKKYLPAETRAYPAKVLAAMRKMEGVA